MSNFFPHFHPSFWKPSNSHHMNERRTFPIQTLYFLCLISTHLLSAVKLTLTSSSWAESRHQRMSLLQNRTNFWRVCLYFCKKLKNSLKDWNIIYYKTSLLCQYLVNIHPRLSRKKKQNKKKTNWTWKLWEIWHYEWKEKNCIEQFYSLWIFLDCYVVYWSENLFRRWFMLCQNIGKFTSFLCCGICKGSWEIKSLLVSQMDIILPVTSLCRRRHQRICRRTSE